MLPNCSGGCAAQPMAQEQPIVVRFTADFEGFCQGEEHRIQGQDPVEEVAIVGPQQARVPYAVLERVDGEPFDSMDDLLGVARIQLALRT
jgi:hypothetical protein